MLNFNCNERFESKDCELDNFAEKIILDDDMVMEEILINLNKTPLGQVLKRIAGLPEVRKNKILNLRRQIYQGQYKLNERLDSTLEKVLNDLDE